MIFFNQQHHYHYCYHRLCTFLYRAPLIDMFRPSWIENTFRPSSWIENTFKRMFSWDRWLNQHTKKRYYQENFSNRVRLPNQFQIIL